MLGGGGGILSPKSGGASGSGASGGSGLIAGGGMGGPSVNPYLSSNPFAMGKVSNASAFGNVTGSRISLGNASSGQGGLTIYEPYVYAPTSSEQSYSPYTYAPTTTNTTNQQITNTTNQQTKIGLFG